MDYICVIFISSLIFLPGNTKNLGLETNDIVDSLLSANINFIFDIILKHYKTRLINEGQTEIPISDFEKQFSTKVFIISLEGHMLFSKGSLKNLSSIQRTGDASIDKIGTDFIITAHLGISNFQVTFEHYELSLMGITQNGRISATVGENSVCIKISVTLTPKCTVELKSLDLENINDVEVYISDLGPFTSLTDYVTSWVISHIIHSYKTNLEGLIFGDIEKAIKDADICHYIPF
uniref:Lipid-binding serum glycoprotein N-terminal domain-containing protein n=1 Tax=Clastoptera arizonana TaxID=38151 RepID=A0A1B6EC04_9HEMI